MHLCIGKLRTTSGKFETPVKQEAGADLVYHRSAKAEAEKKISRIPHSNLGHIRAWKNIPTPRMVTKVATQVRDRMQTDASIVTGARLEEMLQGLSAVPADKPAANLLTPQAHCLSAVAADKPAVIIVHRHGCFDQ